MNNQKEHDEYRDELAEQLRNTNDQIERLQKLRDTSADLSRPASVMEFATHLFSPRAQGAMADSEAFAHLEHLRIMGDFERRDNSGTFEYVLKD